MSWEKPLSQAALDDHSEYMQKLAADLAAEPPPLAPRAVAPIRSGITQAQLDRALSRLSVTLGKCVRQLVVEPLERKIADLEQKQLKLGGVWKAGERYKENTVVTHAGGLWLALADTDTRPGGGSPAWRLAANEDRRHELARGFTNARRDQAGGRDAGAP